LRARFVLAHHFFSIFSFVLTACTQRLHVEEVRRDAMCGRAEDTSEAVTRALRAPLLVSVVAMVFFFFFFFFILFYFLLHIF
jgi:hypothetical protein